jgi:hypothetical protein
MSLFSQSRIVFVTLPCTPRYRAILPYMALAGAHQLQRVMDWRYARKRNRLPPKHRIERHPNKGHVHDARSIWGK